MPAFKQVVKKHMDNIVNALESKNVEKALQALYEFGNVLLIHYPDKNYTGIQKSLEKFCDEYKNYLLSDDAVSQIAALNEMIIIYNSDADRANKNEDRTAAGDLSMIITNHALKNATLCFDCLMPPSYHAKRIDDKLRTISDGLTHAQLDQVTDWMDKTISKVSLSKKYNLKHLDKICKITEEKLLKEIDLKKKDIFSKTIAIDQHNKIKELRACLAQDKYIEHVHQNLFSFIEIYNKDETQILFNKSSLGKNFSERIKTLFNAAFVTGIVSAYGMWKQHKVIGELQKEIQAIKKTP